MLISFSTLTTVTENCKDVKCEDDYINVPTFQVSTVGRGPKFCADGRFANSRTSEQDNREAELESLDHNGFSVTSTNQSCSGRGSRG